MSAYECEPCGRTFRLFAHYEAHMIHSTRHHYCTPCGRDFVSEAAKQSHLRHSERHLPCQWCHTLVGKLLTHNRKYHEQCEECREWFEDAAAVHIHSQCDHSDVYCAPCQRLFDSPNNLRMHRGSNLHQPKNFRCPGEICGREFISRAALVLHLEAYSCESGFDLEDVDREFSARCDRRQRFVQKDMIFPTSQADTSRDEYGRYPCTRCPKSFRTYGQLAVHFKSPKHKNRGYKAYSCPSAHCTKGNFYSLGNLLLHLQTQDCGKFFEEELFRLVDKLLDII